MSAFEKHFSVRKMHIKSKQQQFADSAFVYMYRCLLELYKCIEEYAKRRSEQTDGGMETRLADDASVHSPELINRASHADPSRVLTTCLICSSIFRVSFSFTRM